MPIDPDLALRRIAPAIRRTPVLQCTALSALAGARLSFKAEHLQHTGSFKFRGACHAVAELPDDCPGVATHSSGNHGAALAAAAAARGLTAHVVMPRNAVAAKAAAVRRLGGTIHFCEPTQTAREHGLQALVAAGYAPVPPYDDERIIAGQATVAMELIAQQPEIDCIVAPIGGGGLLAGVTIATARYASWIEVIGAEPSGADDAARSLAQGRRVDDHQPETIADGLRALVGVRNLEILARHRTRILTCSESGIVTAMRLIWQHLKQVVEPSAAAGLATLLEHREYFAGRRVGIVLTGGNLDTERLLEHLEVTHG
ncbi:MAG: pyridoxal-phosphate dependent enzyme [Wenzhouxiangellaceae bacterium]